MEIISSIINSIFELIDVFVEEGLADVIYDFVVFLHTSDMCEVVYPDGGLGIKHVQASELLVIEPGDVCRGHWTRVAAMTCLWSVCSTSSHPPDRLVVLTNGMLCGRQLVV